MTDEYERQEFWSKVKKTIKEIAESYHDRIVYSSMFSTEKLICRCCNNSVHSLCSIEHDSQDYSKDLNICLDCYTKIRDYWKENKPKKISPI